MRQDLLYPSCPQTHYVTLDDLELPIHRPHLPRCWDSRQVPLSLTAFCSSAFNVFRQVFHTELSALVSCFKPTVLRIKPKHHTVTCCTLPTHPESLWLLPTVPSLNKPCSSTVWALQLLLTRGGPVVGCVLNVFRAPIRALISLHGNYIFAIPLS